MTTAKFAVTLLVCSWALCAATPTEASVAIWNTSTTGHLWVTIYKWGAMKNTILKSFCVAPGQRMSSAPNLTFQDLMVIRGELTANPGCKHPVICDTQIQAYYKKGEEWYDLKVDGNPCYWDQYMESSSPRWRNYPNPPYVCSLAQSKAAKYPPDCK